ncbi:MAG: hypothetical protein QXU44_09980 [Candidatus Caldarchaeum sp.]
MELGKVEAGRRLPGFVSVKKTLSLFDRHSYGVIVSGHTVTIGIDGAKYIAFTDNSPKAGMIQVASDPAILWLLSSIEISSSPSNEGFSRNQYQ